MFKLSYSQSTINTQIVNNSRNSCVKIISQKGQSSGTGFFISENLIATCFHVIASTETIENSINFNVFDDIQIITENGEIVNAICISVPSTESPEPLHQDFAILKVNTTVKNKTILSLSEKITYNITAPVIFSGYPLGTPTMVSHLGSISGITKDNSLICIQASTNKGNSGGALVDDQGQVLGIISLREGGISLGLQNYLSKINDSEKQGSIQLMGIDPLQASKETITILDKYISTGIGYARNISFLSEYIKKHNIKL
ncbi:hypothetical protein FBFR_09430 [Flavobacterium fryxellicola]|uniref:Serine protease n=2 Tax=Flavobacterium fryxellicola TaxID=249352 RepID=A0A167X6I9_9FLAO|nr:hypothetical protein FBFR_09430 [Flavobacterium fryxellicola]